MGWQLTTPVSPTASGVRVSENFEAVGVRPLVGQTFTPQQDETGAAPVAAISIACGKRIRRRPKRRARPRLMVAR
jgi:hypothetical protein